MGEILFRGKTQDDKWVYWNEYGELVTQSGKKHSRYAYHRTQNSVSYYYYVHALKDSKLLLKDTIGRFTGLTDRNGEKIFEGDILQEYNGDDRGYIRYDNEDGMYYLVVDHILYDFSACNSLWYEVYGDVYDNPGFLEESNGKEEN